MTETPETTPEATPAPRPELLKTPELLGKNAAEQALWLIGKRPPAEGESLTLDETEKEQIKKSFTEGIPADHKEKIKNASLNEREEYWKGKTDAMNTWKTSTNTFLDVYKEDMSKSAEQKFLKNILKLDENVDLNNINADKIYDTFMKGEGAGNVEFFARRIVETNSLEELQNKGVQDLIQKLGNIYGANSAKISELLTHGMANVKYKENDFFASAQKNLDDKNYGDSEIWEALDKNSGQFEEKEKVKKEEARIAAEKLQKQKDEAAEAERIKEENEKKAKIIADTRLNKELELVAKLEEGEMGEFENRIIVIPESINRRLEEIIKSDDGVEKKGFLIYKKGKEGEKKYLIEEMLIYAKVKDGSEESYPNEVKIINEFSTKNKDYGVIELFSHSKNSNEEGPEELSEGSIDHIKNLATHKEDRNRMYILATPGKRTIVGIGDPNSIIENYEGYTEDNFVSREFKRIEEEIKQGQEVTKYPVASINPNIGENADDEEVKREYQQEASVAVKFVQEFKEGKMELDKALDYFGKLRDLREKNKQYFESFIYFEMGTEIEKPRPEDIGKERINPHEKERARIIDALIEQAKKLSGSDPAKENEYKEKIQKVFKVLSISADEFGFYKREGNKDNKDWLGIEHAKTS